MTYEEPRPCWNCGGVGGKFTKKENRIIAIKCSKCKGSGSYLEDVYPEDYPMWQIYENRKAYSLMKTWMG